MWEAFVWSRCENAWRWWSAFTSEKVALKRTKVLNGKCRFIVYDPDEKVILNVGVR